MNIAINRHDKKSSTEIKFMSLLLKLILMLYNRHDKKFSTEGKGQSICLIEINI